MSHMQPQITQKMLGWKVETLDAGTCYVPGDVVQVPRNIAQDVPLQRDADFDLFDLLAGRLADYVDGRKFEEIEVVRLYFARLSAPGYLDCTEWCGFNTLKEAREYLRDL